MDITEIHIPFPRPEFSLLAVFLLALLNDEVPRTLYDFLRGLSLSSGAAAPALGKLLEDQLIVATGSASKKEYQITSRGKKVLEDNWYPFLKKPAKDLSESLRIVWLPLSLGQDDLAAKELVEGAHARQRLAAQISRKTASKSDPLLERYQAAYASIRAAGLLAEAEALKKLAGEIDPSTKITAVEQEHPPKGNRA